MSHGDVTKIPLIHRHQLNFPSALSLLVVKQWGTTQIGAGNLTSETTTFPIAFTRFYRIAGLHCAIGGADSFDAYIGNLSSVYFRKTTTGSDTFTICWIAVGL